MGVATVAVLFTDLVDSTAEAERLGPAEADRSRRAHFDALRAVVRSHHGTEVKSTGDGLMLVFASPSDAVACAGALQSAQARSAPEPTMRVGVSVGEATNEDDDWFGLPVVRAARLCAAAQPGEVLVDELVVALADRASATLEPVGELALKGLSRPVHTLRLVWEPGGAEVPLPGALRPTGVPLVGRDEELERLAAAWARAGDGQRNGDGTFTLDPVGHPDTYDVTLFGEGDGDLFVSFRWTTTEEGALARPEARLALVASNDGVPDSYGVEPMLSNLATTPVDAIATITVRSRGGDALAFDATRAPGCLAEGTAYWDGPDERGLAAAALGETPFTYEVQVVLDGSRHVATALWPDDEIAGNEPSVELEFLPAPPALRQRRLRRRPEPLLDAAHLCRPSAALGALVSVSHTGQSGRGDPEPPSAASLCAGH